MLTQPLSAATPSQSRCDSILSLKLTRQGQLALVKVSGRLDMDNAHLLIELVDYLTHDRPLKLVLDLARTTALSAHGLTALLQVQQTVAAVGGQLVLRSPSPVARYLLGVSGALDQFDVQDGTVRHRPERQVGPGTSLVAQPGAGIARARERERPSIVADAV